MSVCFLFGMMTEMGWFVIEMVPDIRKSGAYLFSELFVDCI